MFKIKTLFVFSFHLFLTVLLVLVGGKVVKGQRVYADAETHSPKLEINVLLATVTLAEVTNPSNSVNPVYSDFSTLFTTVDLLSLIESWQNIKFTGLNKPISNTPITIKFGGDKSLLSLLNGISIQPTLNGTLTGNQYSSSTLLDLLSILGNPGDAEITLPAPAVSYDGIRFKVSATLLGTAITGRLYYAFFIVGPKVEPKTICSNTPVTLTVTNSQPGYTYNWYNSNGVLLQSSLNSTYNPSSTTTGTYYVEAVETATGHSYYSAKVPVTVTVLTLPQAPAVVPQTN